MKKLYIQAAVLVAGVAIGFNPGCAKKESGQTDGRLKVVATTGMIGDAVAEIAGDRVELYTMMGPGVDPHLYKATRGDIDHLHEADMVVYNGLHLEAKLVEVFEKMTDTKMVVAAADAIPDSLIRKGVMTHGQPDPHVWFDVSLWRYAVENIGRSLLAADSANARFYGENLDRYLVQLDSLHTWVRGEIVTIPKEQRVLVTAHDAFGYFGRAYDIEVEGLQGISTVTEAGLYDVTNMVDVLVSRHIKAVFVESSVPRKSIDAVVEGCEARGHQIAIGGELFSDAMGAAGTPEGHYLGMVRHNVNLIVKALK